MVVCYFGSGIEAIRQAQAYPGIRRQNGSDSDLGDKMLNTHTKKTLPITGTRCSKGDAIAF
eukprot:scaffold61301_cov45-Attheya_sp.AAC.10